jgi:hypothetical protein
MMRAVFGFDRVIAMACGNPVVISSKLTPAIATARHSLKKSR